MTELQKTEFDILCAFDSVCRQLELPYFLVCGTALGAVKYGGFIPWDDDIDVAMYRADYEKFLREGPTLLPPHLFLQNWRTDPACPHMGSKLRNSDTTYIEKSVAHLPMHHGVFLDIFPLDGYPQGRAAQRMFELRKRLYTAMVQSACEYPRSAAGNILCAACRILGISKHTDRVAARYENMLRRYDGGMACNHTNWQGKLDYFPKSHFGQGRLVSFEGLQALVPRETDAYLRQKYGDYLADLPQAQRRGHHTFTVCDCRKPYKDQGK